METASWAGFAMAALALGGNVVSIVNARKSAKDKLDHEAKMKEIELDAKRKDEDLLEVRQALNDCREQHEASERDRDGLRKRIEEIEKDRSQLLMKLSLLEQQVAAVSAKKRGA